MGPSHLVRADPAVPLLLQNFCDLIIIKWFYKDHRAGAIEDEVENKIDGIYYWIIYTYSRVFKLVADQVSWNFKSQ